VRGVQDAQKGSTATGWAGTEAAVAPPPGHDRFPLFDSLRAIAALSVLVFHAAQVADTETERTGDTWWEALTARLPVGVTIFFLVSGFLLYRPFVVARYGGAPAPRIRDFARRRVLRIVPAFWVALILMYPLGLAWIPGGLFPESLVILGFLQSWSDEFFTAGLGVSWSLSVEAAFYVILPFYAALTARLLGKRTPAVAARLELIALSALAVASLVFTAVAFDRGAFALADALPGNFSWFALGMGLAVLSAASWPKRRGPAAFIATSASTAWALALSLLLTTTLIGLPGLGEGFPSTHSTPEWVVQKVLYGLISVLLLLPAVFAPDRGGVPRRILADRRLMWVGLVSYGLYLWHTPLIGWYREHGPGLSGQASGVAFVHVVAVGLAATLVAAAASYYVVERPMLRFKNGFPSPSLRRRSATLVRSELRGGRAAPARARALVTDSFAGRLPPDQLDSLRLLVDEVVTNSVVHGGVDDSGTITLAIHATDGSIRVEASDTGHQGSPELRPPDIERGDGFGLFLVSQIATSWGAFHDPQLRVWFEISIRPSLPASPSTSRARPAKRALAAQGTMSGHARLSDRWTGPAASRLGHEPS